MKFEIPCTWKDEEEFQSCANHNKLHCRWKASDLFLFMTLVLPGMLGALAGTILITITVTTTLSLLSMWTVMIKYICSACVDFSCPFNRVDKNNRDTYLSKNPVMCKAWEEKGYHLDLFICKLFK